MSVSAPKLNRHPTRNTHTHMPGESLAPTTQTWWGPVLPVCPNCRRYLRLASFHQAESPSHPHPGTVPWGQWDQYYQPFALIEGCGTKLLSFYFKRNQTNFLKKRKRWANSSKYNMKAQLHSATSAQYLPEWVFLEEPRRILD